MGEEDEDRGACLVQSPRGEGGCCPSLNTCQIPPSPRPFHAIILSPILPRVSDRRHREKARHRLRDAGHDPAAGTTWATVGSRGPNSTRTPPPRGKLALARNAQRRTVSGRPSPPPCRDAVTLDPTPAHQPPTGQEPGLGPPRPALDHGTKPRNDLLEEKIERGTQVPYMRRLFCGEPQRLQRPRPPSRRPGDGRSRPPKRAE